MPAVGSGADGAVAMRQRVTAADGAPSGSVASPLRVDAWRFISSAIVRPPSAASCNRRVAVMETRLASPITAPRPSSRAQMSPNSAAVFSPLKCLCMSGSTKARVRMFRRGRPQM